MSFSFKFKKIIHFCFIATLLFLITDTLSAQIKYRTNTRNIEKTPNVGNIDSGDCCKNAQGTCVKKGTNTPCSGVSDCMPCSQQSTGINASWGQAGSGVACIKCPSCNDCNNALVFNTPRIKDQIPLFVDKEGQTYISTALNIGGGKLVAGNNSIGIAGNFEPIKGNAFSLGSPKNPFQSVYASKLVGQVSKYSDRRLKTNISASPYGLQTVLQLKPSIYHYKNDLEGGQKLGLIAQDLQQTVPEIVDESGEFLSVDYSALVPVLIQAIQDQQAIIEAQKSTIEGQKTALEQTQTELKGLKANLEEVMDFLQLKAEKVSDVNE